MPARIIEWLQLLSGTEDVSVTFYSEPDGKYNNSSFASCYVKHSAYTINLRSFEEYKDDDATIMYLVGHEAGHNLDPRFKTLGRTTGEWGFILLGILSILIIIFSVWLLGDAYNKIAVWLVIIWFAAAELTMLPKSRYVL